MSERDQFEGKTLSDAIERASMKFNATRDRIEYRILKESQGGFFGLLGGKILIEAWVRETSSGRDIESKYDIPTEEAVERTAAEGTGRGGEPRGERQTGEQRGGQRGCRRRGRGGPRERDGGARQGPEDQPRERTPREQRPVAEEPVVVAPEVETFVKGLFVHLGETPEISLEENDQQLLVRLAVAQDSVFSSREGHTIESLKFILDKIVNKGPVIRKRVKVHVTETVSPDQAEWARIGDELGKKALSIGRPICVRGLSPADRKVIHTAVMHLHAVNTVSSGEGNLRKLYIVPKNARPPAPVKTTSESEEGAGGQPPAAKDEG